MGTYLKIAIKNVASPTCDFQYTFMIMIITNIVLSFFRSFDHQGSL